MKKITLLALLLIAASACQKEKEKQKENAMALNYPETKKVDTIDTYFGNEIPDPYRWLEDDHSDETKAWVKAQNEVTFDYLDQISYRKDLENRLTELWDYEKIGVPFKRGNYIYFYKNDGLQNQSVIYRYKKDEDPDQAEVFLDPNSFSKDGSTSLDQMSFTEDGGLVAYTISEGGSDWRKVIVLETENKKQVGDTLINVKFSGISWHGNEGFFYSSYDAPEGSQLSAKTDQHKLYFHKLNTPQKEDEIIFGGKDSEKHRYVGGSVTEDNRFLMISASNTTSGNNLYIKDLTANDNTIHELIKSDEANTHLLTTKGTTLYLVTDLDAPNKRVVTVDFENLSQDNWKDFIAESDKVLGASTAGKYIFAHYMKDALTQIKQYDLDGKEIREVELPGLGSAGGFSSRKNEEDVYYSFTNYVTPPTIYKYDLETGNSEEYQKPDIDFNPEDYESKQVFYTSKDGTKVPMMITFKKGIEMNGQNPTMLYAYGGFNISLTPSFSVANLAWLERGGIYAVPNLRGGGEYGREWHKAGTQMQKQNVFDDFIAAAEYLIENNYTSSEYLAIRGGSNGGLLVGATMTQRPDLMKVALPAVGVLDMLRYHTFTAGAGWAYDYGTAEDNEEMFEYLRAYSPVHNVKEGIEYPATMVTTGDHDDRVVPAHSFKFAAELQDKQTGENPVLIRVQINAGHGAGKPTSMIIDEYVDIFAFTLYNMGFDELPQL